MNNYGMAVDATTTALHSQGSAMRENGKYQESLEARLATLKTAWVEFVEIAGDATLYAMIVNVTAALQGLTEGGGGVVSKIGILAPLVGALTTMIMLIAPQLRAFTISLATAATMAKAASVAVSGLVVALKALGVAMLIGAVVGALALAFDKLNNAMAEARIEQERIELAMKTASENFSQNSEKISDLSDQYAKLSKAMNAGIASEEQEKEYLSVRSELASLMPTLIEGYDKEGVALIGTAEKLETYIALMERKLELDRQEALIGAPESLATNQEETEATEGEIKDLKKEIGRLEKEAKDKGLDEKTLDREHIGTLSKDWLTLEEQIVAKKQESTDLDLEKMAKEQERLDLYKQLLKYSVNLTEEDKNWLAQRANEKDFGDVEDDGFKVKADEEVDRIGNVRKLFDSSVIPTADLEKMEKAGKEGDKQIDTLSALGLAYTNGEMELNEYEKALEAVFEDEELVGKIMDSVREKIKSTEQVVEGITEEFKAFAKVSEVFGFDGGGSENGGAAHLQELVTAYLALTSVTDQTEESQTALEGVVKRMATIFPQYVEKVGEAGDSVQDLYDVNIAGMQNEIEMNRVMGDAMQALADGQLNAEQIKTVGALMGSKQRIKILTDEAAAMEKKAADMRKNGVQNAQTYSSANALENEAKKNREEAAATTDAVVNQTAELDMVLQNQAKGIEENTKKYDAWKKAIQSLDLAMEQLEGVKNNFVSGSEGYQAAIADEIALLQKKKASILESRDALKAEMEEAKKSLKVQEGSTVSDHYESQYNEDGSLKGEFQHSRVAVSDGVVDRTGYDAERGNYAVVRHEDDNGQMYETKYFGLLAETMAKVGDKILAGQEVGQNTGEDQSLAIEVTLPDGSKQNIMTWLSENAQETLVVGADEAAKETYDEMQSELERIQTETEEAIRDHIQSLIDSALQAIEDIDREAKISELKMSSMDTASAGYRGEIDTQIGVQGDKQEQMRENIALLEKELERTDLTEAHREMINEQIDEMNIGLLESNNLIDDMETDKFNSTLEEATDKITVVDDKIKASQSSMNSMASSSADYRAELDKQIALEKERQALLLQNIALIEAELARTDLTGKQRSEMNDQLRDMNSQLAQSVETIADMNMDKLTSKIEEQNEKIEERDNLIKQSQIRSEQMDKTSSDYRQELDKQIVLERQKQDLMRTNLSILQAELQSTALTAKARAEISKQIMDINTQLMESDNIISNLQFDKVQSKFEAKQAQITIKDDMIEKSKMISEDLVKGSKAYRQELDKQIRYELQKQALLRQTIALLQVELKNTALTAAQRAQINGQISTTNMQLLQSAEVVEDTKFDQALSRIEEKERQLDALDEKKQRSDYVKDDLATTSPAYVQETNRQIDIEKQRQKAIQETIAATQKEIASGSLSAVQKEELREKVRNLNMELLESAEIIEDLEYSKMQSELQVLADKLDDVNEKIENSRIRMSRYAEGTKEYRAELQLQIQATQESLAVINQEIAMREKQLRVNAKNLSGEQVKQYREELEELKKQAGQATNEISDLSLEVAKNGSAMAYANKVDELDNKIEMSRITMNMYSEDSAEYRNEMTRQIHLSAQRVKTLQSEKQALLDIIATNKNLTPKQVKELTLEIQALDKEILSTQANIVDLNKQFKDMADGFVDDAKDKMIDAIDKVEEAEKEHYEKLKKEAKDAKDKEVKEYEKAHEKKLRLIKEEFEAEERLINLKLKELDRDSNERDYDNTVAELQEDKLKLEQELRDLASDNTSSGIMRRKELQQEIADIDKQLADEDYSYQTDLAKQRLEDQLEGAEQLRDAKEQAENDAYDTLKERLDEESKEIEEFYDNLIDTDKKYEKMREQVMEGTIDNIGGIIKDLTNTIYADLKELGIELDEGLTKGFVKAAAELQKLKDLQASLPKMGGMINLTNPVDSLDNLSAQGITQADLKLLEAKYLVEKRKDESGVALGAQARKEGATLDSGNNKTLDQLLTSLGENVTTMFNDYINSKYFNKQTVTPITQTSGGTYSNLYDFNTYATSQYDNMKGLYGTSFGLSEADLKLMSGEYMYSNISGMKQNGVATVAEARKEGSTLDKDGTKTFEQILKGMTVEQQKFVQQYLDNVFAAWKGNVEKTINVATEQNKVVAAQNNAVALQNESNAMKTDLIKQLADMNKVTVAEMEKRVKEQQDLAAKMKAVPAEQKAAIQSATDEMAKLLGVSQEGLVKLFGSQESLYLRMVDAMGEIASTVTGDKANSIQSSLSEYEKLTGKYSTGTSLGDKTATNQENLVNTYFKKTDTSNAKTLDWLLDQALMFDKGGYTGNDEGLAMLHEQELVLNKADTKNILEAVKQVRMFEDIASVIAKFGTVPVVPQATATSGSDVAKIADVKIDVNIEELKGGQEGFDEMMKLVNNNLRSKGVSFL